jgi:imidazole glycerol phosphate synthase glutamine amidotransferase subunit
MTGIIDYGAGNLLSVKKALDHLDVKACFIRSERECRDIDRLILPGVGAFGPAVEVLQKSGMYDVIAVWLERKKPFLGICLGMQILCAGSDEAFGTSGFSRFPAIVHHFEHGKVPQIGWNQVTKVRTSCLLQEIPDNTFFYFLHGYYVPVVPGATVATTEYGLTFTSVIEQGTLCAVQFHPEKSGNAGLQVLRNWIDLC